MITCPGSVIVDVIPLGKMVPDYSIEICFRNAQRAIVQSRLSGLCEPEYGERIKSNAFGDEKWEVEICIPAPSDAPPELLRNYRKLPDGTTSIGYIDFEYAPESQYVKIPDCFSIEIWPRTKDMQFIFFSSMDFRTKLTKLLQECDGTCGSIVFESSFPIEFWGLELGRYNDDRPERTELKLLVPHELSAG